MTVETNTELESSGTDYEVWVTHMTRTADKARVSVSLERHGIGTTNPQVYLTQVVTDVTVSDDSSPFVFKLESTREVYKGQTSGQGDPLPDASYDEPFSYITAEVNNAEYDMGEGSNRVLWAEAEDGTVYFTPGLLPYHGGTSAIYRVDEWGSTGYTEEPTTVDGHSCYSDSNARSIGSVARLASFPVDGHQLRTVSLDVVDDHLCLLLVADGMLTLRVYGMDGAFQSEIPLFEVDPDQEFASTLFNNRSEGATMLCYDLQNASSDEFGNNRVLIADEGSTLLCVQLDEGAELVSVLTGHDTLARAAFIDGHWVLAETEHVDYSYGDSSMIPERHYISVLDASGAVLYRGEIMTDQYEDEIQYFVDSGTESPYDLFVGRQFTFSDITEG